jgi:hypothetical protein
MGRPEYSFLQIHSRGAWAANDYGVFLIFPPP